MIRKVGDIVEIDGKKYEVTYVCGENFSYRDYLGPMEEQEPVTEKPVAEEPVRRRTRRK